MAAPITPDDVVAAIRLLADWKGSSRQALAKYFKVEKKVPEDILAPSLKKALEDGLKSGALVQDKSSYKAKGFDFEEPAETRVITETLTEGSGDATVQAHDSITVNYVGRLTDGTQFDASDDFEFEVDGGEVIKGWDRGVLGMKKGEKRKLTIPPKMGYGKRGSPPEVPGNATLEFDITLVGIKR